MGILDEFNDAANKYDPFRFVQNMGGSALKPVSKWIREQYADEVDTRQATQDILNGDKTLDDYHDFDRDEITKYWATDPEAFAGAASANQLSIAQKQANDQVALKALTDSVYFKPTEWAGAKFAWLMSETTSPLLSTAGLSVHHMIYGYAPGEDMGWGGIADTWKAAHHVSPGQTLWQLGLNNKELTERGLDARTLAEADKRGAFSRGPREQVEGAEKIRDAYYSSGTQKWISGSADFAANWFADPTVVGGKALKSVKLAKLDRAVTTTNKGIGRLTELKGIYSARQKLIAEQAAKGEAIAPASGSNLPGGVQGPIGREQAIDVALGHGLQTAPNKAKLVANAIAESRYGGRVDGLSQSPAILALRDHISNIKAQYGPEVGIAKLRSSADTFTKNADGDTLARAVYHARDDEELLTVLRVATGDADAMQKLIATNRTLAEQMRVATTEAAQLDQKYNAMTPAEQTQPLGIGRMNRLQWDQVQAKLDGLEAETKQISTILDAQNKIRNLHFNEWASPKMQSFMEKVKGDDIAPSGMISSRLYGAAKMLHGAWSGIKPSGFVSVHDVNSFKDVDAILRETGFTQANRQYWVGKYIAADQSTRGTVLLEIEAEAVKQLAKKYGVSSTMAKTLFDEYNLKRDNMAATMRSYSAAPYVNPADPTAAGRAASFRVAELDGDGASVIASPILQGHILNNHVMMNFEAMERVLKDNAAGLERLRLGSRKPQEVAKAVAELTDRYWKLATLARVGYPIRSVADDLLGQTARAGATNMAWRAFKGTYRSKWVRGVLGRNTKENDLAQATLLETHADDLVQKVAAAEKNIEKSIQRAAMHGKTSPAKRRKALARADALRDQLKDLDRELIDTRTAIGNLRDKHSSTMFEQIFTRGTLLPGAYEGTEGKIFRDANSGTRNTANLMGRPADWHLKEMRNAGWTHVTVESVGPEQHMRSWLRDINQQIRTDPLAMELIRNGGDVKAAVRWLGQPEGREHFAALGLKNIGREELAARVNAHVNHYLNPVHPGMDGLRAKLLTEELKGDELAKVVDVAMRPEVNGELLTHAMGRGILARGVDAGITGFYRIMNEMPSQYLLKNPLFAQLYRGSVRQQMSMFQKQGVTHMTEEMRQRIITTARQDALADAKKFTFNMDHETKLSHYMRYVIPFIGAQQESFNRWARIFMEKPDLVGKGVLLYTSPMRTGHAVDQDGDPVVNGYATKKYKDPVTGEIKTKRVLVDRTDIMVQIPDYLGGKALGKFFGGDGKTAAQVPMSSLNFTVPSDFTSLQAGPYAQISANWFVNHGSKESMPDRIALTKALGILPYGPQEGLLDPVTPAWLKAINVDEEDDQYQKWMFDTMAAEDYRFQTGQRESKPSWGEIKERADHLYWMNFISKESGFNPKAQNPYQFFINEHRKMVDLYGPEEGRTRYVQKYGDASFVFAQSMSKNAANIRPTKGGVRVFGELRDVIDQLEDPSLAGVLIGQQDGVYDQGAYYALKQTPLQTGSIKKAMGKQDAADAWRDAKISMGWQRYNSVMNQLDADLYSSGFTSYGDPGAEAFKDRRDKLVSLFNTEEVNGEANPYFNPEWVEEFNTFDKGKYDARARDLSRALSNPIIQQRAMSVDGVTGIQSELVSLSKYLNMREDVERELKNRKALGYSGDIMANENSDLRDTVGAIVDDLKEKDTRFGDIFNRYFGSDMGYAQRQKEQYAFGEEEIPQPTLTASAGLEQALSGGGF